MVELNLKSTPYPSIRTSYVFESIIAIFIICSVYCSTRYQFTY